jgi:hypothetical protein
LKRLKPDSLYHAFGEVNGMDSSGGKFEMVDDATGFDGLLEEGAAVGEEGGKPIFGGCGIPGKVVSEVGEADGSMPAISVFFAGEGNDRVGGEMARRGGAQVVELNCQAAAGGWAATHHAASGNELEELRDIGDGPIGIENAAYQMLRREGAHLKYYLIRRFKEAACYYDAQ